MLASSRRSIPLSSPSISTPVLPSAHQVAPFDDHFGPFLVAHDLQHRARGPRVSPRGDCDLVAAEDLPLGPLKHRFYKTGFPARHREVVSGFRVHETKTEIA